MTLPSGLEVLLVSTAKLVASKGQPLDSAKAAAAMCVQVGSFADPPEAEGEGLVHGLHCCAVKRMKVYLPISFN